MGLEEVGVFIVEMIDEVAGLIRSSPVLAPQPVECHSQCLPVLGAQLSLQGIYALLACRSEVVVAHHAETGGGEHQVELTKHAEEGRQAHELLEPINERRTFAEVFHALHASHAEQDILTEGKLPFYGWLHALIYAVIGSRSNGQGLFEITLGYCYLHCRLSLSFH